MDINGHGKSWKNAHENVLESHGKPLSLFYTQHTLSFLWT